MHYGCFFENEIIGWHTLTRLYSKLMVDALNTSVEAYSAAGGMGFGWWLVEHYLPYHVDCPNGCGLGETAGGG